MDLKEFGRLLKEERLRQGLEITDVMDKTKISRMNLTAIEEGNEKALPHPVYAKGFVKNYARFLGMDADKMGNALAQIYFSRDESDFDGLVLAEAEKLPAVKEDWSRLIGILLGLTVFLAALFSGGWFFKDNIREFFSGDGPEDVSGTTAGQPGAESFLGVGPSGDLVTGENNRGIDAEPGTLAFPVLTEEVMDEAPEDVGLPELQSQEMDVAEAGRPRAEAEPRLSQPDGPSEVQLETPPSRIPETPVAPAPAEEMDQPESTSPGQVAAEPDRVREPALAPVGVEKTLEIRATENCWLSARADGARPREAFLRPGERFVITFEDTLELRLGNAGGVALYMDGNPWPFSARSGEVMSLRFP